MASLEKNGHPAEIQFFRNVEGGAFNRRYITLNEGETIVIKRKEESEYKTEENLLFTNETVSAKHAILFLKDGIFYIEDQNSTNGTYINSLRLEKFKPALLTDHYVVQFGKKLGKKYHQ